MRTLRDMRTFGDLGDVRTLKDVSTLRDDTDVFPVIKYTNLSFFRLTSVL